MANTQNGPITSRYSLICVSNIKCLTRPLKRGSNWVTRGEWLQSEVLVGVVAGGGRREAMPLEAHHCKTLSASTRQVQSFCHKNFYRSIKLVHFSTKQRRNNPKSTKQKDKNKKKKNNTKNKETSRNLEKPEKSMSEIGTRINSIGRTFSKFSCCLLPLLLLKTKCK